MKKEIYLVLACSKKEFRELAKKGYRCKVMEYRCNTSPMWATSTRSEAIEDCRSYNRQTSEESCYFFQVINLY